MYLYYDNIGEKMGHVVCYLETAPVLMPPVCVVGNAGDLQALDCGYCDCISAVDLWHSAVDLRLTGPLEIIPEADIERPCFCIGHEKELPCYYHSKGPSLVFAAVDDVSAGAPWYLPV